MIRIITSALAASRVYASIIFYRGILMVNNKTKVLTSRKSISDSSSQTLFLAESVTAGNTPAFAGYMLLCSCEFRDILIQGLQVNIAQKIDSMHLLSLVV